MEQLSDQLFFSGVPAKSASAGNLADRPFGGFFLTGRSSSGADHARILITSLKSLGTTAGISPFVGIDQEGGKVQVLSGPGFSTIPTAKEQGALQPGSLASDAARWAGELQRVGINLNFAPVVDLVPSSQSAANQPIGALDRNFSSSIPILTTAALAVGESMSHNGVFPVYKHFPGLGFVRGNTDFSSGVIDSVTTSKSDAIGLYRDLLRKGPEAGVMVSTAVYNKIDPSEPAAFSHVVISRILRGSLGFSGLILSDDLANAKQIASVPIKQRGVKFIEAGGDLVVSGSNTLSAMMADGVRDRVVSDPSFRDKVLASVGRVLKAKAASGLLDCDSVKSLPRSN